MCDFLIALTCVCCSADLVVDTFEKKPEGRKVYDNELVSAVMKAAKERKQPNLVENAVGAKATINTMRDGWSFRGFVDIGTDQGLVFSQEKMDQVVYWVRNSSNEFTVPVVGIAYMRGGEVVFFVGRAAPNR